MALRFSIRTNGSEEDHYLPNLNSSARSSLWIDCADEIFTEKDFENLFLAFVPLRAVVWHTKSSKPEVQAAQGEKAWAKRVAGIIAATEVTYPMYGLPSQSTVEWADPAIMPGIICFQGWSQSVLSFVSNERRVAKQWARIVQGIHWLWLCNDWVANSPTPALDAHSVVLSYIQLTLAINGVAGLLWKDCDLRSGFTFFAADDVLQEAALRLEELGASPAPEVFARLFKRGFFFEPCK